MQEGPVPCPLWPQLTQELSLLAVTVVDPRECKEVLICKELTDCWHMYSFMFFRQPKGWKNFWIPGNALEILTPLYLLPPVSFPFYDIIIEARDWSAYHWVLCSNGLILPELVLLEGFHNQTGVFWKLYLESYTVKLWECEEGNVSFFNMRNLKWI